MSEESVERLLELLPELDPPALHVLEVFCAEHRAGRKWLSEEEVAKVFNASERASLTLFERDNAISFLDFGGTQGYMLANPREVSEALERLGLLREEQPLDRSPRERLSGLAEKSG